MAIEAPLRELGIQDVFQLLDLSRKTGTLHVTSENKTLEGVVSFEKGRVVHAAIVGQPSTATELLLSAGRVSQLDLEHAKRFAVLSEGAATAMDVLITAGSVTSRAVERLLNSHAESVVFELMTWRDGFCRFIEKPLTIAREDRVSLRAEALLMENARRVDEWSHIVDLVPDLSAVPETAPEAADEATPLDLLPHDWEVLGLIDGVRDVRTLANTLMKPAGDIAKVLHTLIAKGLVRIRAEEIADVL